VWVSFLINGWCRNGGNETFELVWAIHSLRGPTYCIEFAPRSMGPLFAPALLSVFSQISFSPATLSARGEQTATLNVARMGMVSTTVSGSTPLRCVLVDRASGVLVDKSFRSGCAFTELLDAGEYLLRISAPDDGTGTLTLSAKAFTESEQSIKELPVGGHLVRTLALGEQMSVWLKVEARRPLGVVLMGVNAGQVRLLRNGEWNMPEALSHQIDNTARNGATHFWRTSGEIEPGEYLLTAYGVEPAQTATAPLTTSVSIFREPQAFDTGTYTITFDQNGEQVVSLPPRSLSLLRPSDKSSGTFGQQFISFDGPGLGSSCVIAPESLEHECLLPASPGSPTMLRLFGPQGKTATLSVFPAPTGQVLLKSAFVGGTDNAKLLVEAPKSYLIASQDFPDTIDESDSSCALQREDDGSKVPLARDFVTIEPNTGWSRAFNYQPGGVNMPFEVVSPGTYRILAEGGRRSICELYALEANGTSKRLTQSRKNALCDVSVTLSPGPHLLRLSGGQSGVERLSISTPQLKQKPVASAHKSSCTMGIVSLPKGSYRLDNTATAAQSRAVTFEPLPLETATPIYFSLRANETLNLPLGNLLPTVLTFEADAKIGCTLPNVSVEQSTTACRLPAVNGQTLSLKNGSAKTQRVVLQPAPKKPAQMSAVDFRPTAPSIEPLQPGEPKGRRFQRAQRHTFLLRVEKPGLYELTTEGLLSTACSIQSHLREPMAGPAASGRGLNCNVEQFLNAGSYLVTAQTVRESAGHGFVRVTQQSIKDLTPLVTDTEAFVRAEAQQLVSQPFQVKKPGRYRITATTPALAQACRLEDARGFPLTQVLTPCAHSLDLAAGTYRLIQYPQAIASTRRVAIRSESEAPRLTGASLHGIEFFHWYDAEIAREAHQDFSFHLAASATVDVVLTNQMQGRVLKKDGSNWTVVGFLPALPEPAAPLETQPGEEENADVTEQTMEGDTVSEGEGAPETESDAAPPSASSASQSAASNDGIPTWPSAPSGNRVTLEAGDYKLEVAHSRGDIGIAYRIHLAADVFQPGMKRTIPVPAAVPLRIGTATTLLVESTGDLPTQCRLFNTARAQLNDNGSGSANWNCASAKRVVPGDYQLEVEAPSGMKGASELSVRALDDAPLPRPLTNTTLTLSNKTALITFAAPPSDGVTEFIARAKTTTPFSCSLDNNRGETLHTFNGTSCNLMFRNRAEPFTVRLWSATAAVAVEVSTRFRSLEESAKTAKTNDSATVVKIAQAGRFETAPQAYCLERNVDGVLQYCGPTASLSEGEYVFSTFGIRPMRLAMKEVRRGADGRSSIEMLTAAPLIENLASRTPSIFWLSVQADGGAQHSPACQFLGAGNRFELAHGRCDAFSALTASATLRVGAQAAVQKASVKRSSITLPAASGALVPGVQTLKPSAGGTLRLDLNAQSRSQIDIALPAATGAVLLNAAQQVSGTCAPQTSVHACRLQGTGGSLLLFELKEPVTLTLSHQRNDGALPPLLPLTEAFFYRAGRDEFQLSAQDAPKVLQVTGAKACTLTLADARQFLGCTQRVPPGVEGRLTITHEIGHFRAQLTTPGQPVDNWAAAKPSASEWAAPNTFVTAVGNLSARRIRVETAGILHFKSPAGVCGWWVNGVALPADVSFDGCDWSMPVQPGEALIGVRGFANLPLSTQWSWSLERPTSLNEGANGTVTLLDGFPMSFTFEIGKSAVVGLGVDAPSEQVRCRLFSADRQVFREGCHQYQTLAPGKYFWILETQGTPPPKPLRVTPVAYGLRPPDPKVPAVYLDDFLKRNVP
jgi:hypothetical protein